MFTAILLFIIAILVTACLLLVIYRNKAVAEMEEVYEENEEILEKYKNIIDVDAEIIERKQSLKEEVAVAQSDIETLKTIARKEVEKSKLKAKEIINDAQEKAEAVAGEAMEVKNNIDHYKSVEKAIKNSIKGYGEEYLVPNYTVLDDLAEEYSYKHAGQELKRAREHTKKLAKEGLASTCSYSDQTRAQYAKHFVLDAFNGKVDSILSSVKSDNFGKLKQQMTDAYNLVNHNGSAFRDARITLDYLESRTEELKWAVATHELRLQEREEQKRIKQEMREEEKAKREFEKAMKEAEKEEKLLQDAMEKAKAELEAAGAEQKQKYEQQLKELQQKLTEAEEKNQRAISMAQQTKRGHVYVISNIGSFGDDVYKIGLTRRLEPLDRVKELGDASVPFEFDVHAMLYSEDAPNLEKTLHARFCDNQVNKVNPRKEFFRVGVGEVKAVVSEMGIDAKWTMKAEAKEYRETLAMEEGEAKAG